MTRLFFDGNELGSVASAFSTSGLATVGTTNKHSGDYGRRITPVTTGAIFSIFRQADRTLFNQASGRARVYIYPITLPSASEEIFVIRSQFATYKLAIRIDQNGNLSLWDATGSLQVGSTGATTIVAGDRIEVEWQTSLTASLVVRVNGATEISGTGTTLTSNAGDFCTGKVTNRNGSGYDCWFDDMVVDSSDWPGVTSIVRKDVTGDGSAVTWTIGAGGGADYTNVDEIPDNTTDYLTSTLNVGDASLVTFETNASAGISGIIKGVRVVCMCLRNGASDGSIKVRIRSGGTDSDSAAQAPTGAWQGFGHFLTTDPATGSAWTLAALDLIEAGVVENSAVNATRCSTIMLSVEFDPVAPDVYGAGSVTRSRTYSASGTTVITGTRRLGTNLNGILSFSSEMPFTVVNRAARGWQMDDGTTDVSALYRNSDGYVTSMPPGTAYVASVLWDGGITHPTGTFVCLYDGDGLGRFSVAGAGSALTNATAGRFEFTMGSGTFQLRLNTINAASPVTNIRIVAAADELTYASSPFRTPFLNRCKHFGTIRYMDWLHTNFSGVTSSRTASTVYTYHSPYATPVLQVPVEVVVQLANATRTNVWYCFPHGASDAHITEVATYLRDNLHASLKVYFEYSNEVWNSAFGGTYGQQSYALAQANIAGLTGADAEKVAKYYARRACEVMALCTTVFAGRLAQIRRVFAWQTSSGGIFSLNNYIMNQTHPTLGAVTQYVDVLAHAPYFGAPLGTEANAVAVAAMSVANVFADATLGINTIQLPAVYADMTLWNAMCVTYGVEHLYYEAGQHLVVQGSTSVSARDTLFASCQTDALMRTAYNEYLDETFTRGCILPMMFTSIAPNGAGGAGYFGGHGLTESDNLGDGTSTVMKWVGQTQDAIDYTQAPTSVHAGVGHCKVPRTATFEAYFPKTFEGDEYARVNVTDGTNRAWGTWTAVAAGGGSVSFSALSLGGLAGTLTVTVEVRKDNLEYGYAFGDFEFSGGGGGGGLSSLISEDCGFF